MRARVPPPGLFIKPSQISNPSALKASHLKFAFECSQIKCFRDKGALRELPWEPGPLRGSNLSQFGDVDIRNGPAALKAQAERVFGRMTVFLADEFFPLLL